MQLGARDPGSTRYIAFGNATDGELTIDFDQAHGYKRMLGFGQWANTRSPAFLISSSSSIHGGWPMAVDGGHLFINRRFWLDMTKHETVFRMPDNPNDTWNKGDRAWNREVVPGGSEGWVCTTGGTLGDYSEGRTATTDGTTIVVLDSASSVLRIGMYLVINGTQCRIVDISGTTITMDVSVPADGPGLPIAYSAPVFKKFGSIDALFDVGGKWDAHQSNGFVANFDIQQTGTAIRGIGSHSGGSVSGTGEGSVHGDQFVFSVRWNNGTIGEYNGTFNSIGRITGVFLDVNHPESQATWASSKTFRRR